MDMMDGKNIKAMEKLEIKGDRYGMKNGWFMWPANFDPTWLENCNGFTDVGM